MKEFVLDIHTHSLASGHAYGTIREMAAAAAEAGLQLLGLAEHGPAIPGTVHPFYFTNLGVIPKSLYGVQIMHGCEADVLAGGKMDMEERYLRHLDYIIVGIHSQCYENEGETGNTDNVVACMKHEKVFFVSHPDDSNMPLDYDRLVRAAKEYHVALEVNNSSFRKLHLRGDVLGNYRKMLQLCQCYRVPIIVNTDAHDPSAVGDFELARAFLQEINFDEELILNTEVEKFMKFIGK